MMSLVLWVFFCFFGFLLLVFLCIVNCDEGLQLNDSMISQYLNNVDFIRDWILDSHISFFLMCLTGYVSFWL